jgi:rhodanese-related sulfurtransferase
VGQRKRFAAFWHRFLLRFTLDCARSWQIPTLSAAELKARMELPEVFVLDANRATLWERGHVPQAVFVGQEDIPLDRLPPDKDAELVFYCRDTMCLTAYLSAAQARTLGYPNTFVMEGGRKAWAESGFSLVPENGADVLELDQTDADGA